MTGHCHWTKTETAVAWMSQCPELHPLSKKKKKWNQPQAQKVQPVFEDVLGSKGFWWCSAEAPAVENCWCRWARVCYFSKTLRSRRHHGGWRSLLRRGCPALTPSVFAAVSLTEIKRAAINTCMHSLGFCLPPGSHDSFSFYIDEASPVGPEQPETVQNFVSVFGTVAKKLMRKWLATQTMNFISQLEAGIRFFDLRISTKPRDPENELFFAHGLFSATVSEFGFQSTVMSTQTQTMALSRVRVDVKQTRVWDFFEEMEGWWPAVTMTSTATRRRCRAPQAISVFPSLLPNQTSCKGQWVKIVYILTTNNDWTGIKHYIWNLPHWIFLFTTITLP